MERKLDVSKFEAVSRMFVHTVEPRYFEPLGEAKNSSKYREFEIANSK